VGRQGQATEEEEEEEEEEGNYRSQLGKTLAD
jgi:hypothetical protein